MRNPNNPYAATKIAGAGWDGNTASIQSDPRFGQNPNGQQQAQLMPYVPGQRPPSQGMNTNQSMGQQAPPQGSMQQMQGQVPMVTDINGITRPAAFPDSGPAPMQPENIPINEQPDMAAAIQQQQLMQQPPSRAAQLQQGNQSQEDILASMSPSEMSQLAASLGGNNPELQQLLAARTQQQDQLAQVQQLVAQEAIQRRAPAEAQQKAALPALGNKPAEVPQEDGFFDSLTGPLDQTKALINGVSNIQPLMRAAGTNIANNLGLPFGGTPQEQIRPEVMMDPTIHQGNSGLGNLLKSGANKVTGGITNFATNGNPTNPQMVQPQVKAQYDAISQRIAQQNAANPHTSITNTLGTALPLSAIPYVGAPLAGVVANQPGNQAFGALAGAAIQAAPSMIGKLGKMSPEQLAKAEALQARGNSLTLAQATQNPLLHAMERAQEKVPNMRGGMQQTFNRQAEAMRVKYDEILAPVPSSNIPKWLRRPLANKVEGRVDPQQVAKAIEVNQFSKGFKALPTDVQKQLLQQSDDVRTIWPKAETEMELKGNPLSTMWGDTKKVVTALPKALTTQALKYGAKPVMAMNRNPKLVKKGARSLQALLQYLISNPGGNQ